MPGYVPYLRKDKKPMKTFDSLMAHSAESLRRKPVVETGGKRIGRVSGFWIGPSTRRAEFIGITTGWVRGRTHVIPARHATVSDDAKRVQIPFSAYYVKKAPISRPGRELAEVAKEEINAYFGGFAPNRRVTDISEIRPGAEVP
jgi:sporulation protein YlmC with PRC-barrel domain